MIERRARARLTGGAVALRNTPKIVGGIIPTCTRPAATVYRRVTEKMPSVSSADSAEMVRLPENTFRTSPPWVRIAKKTKLIVDTRNALADAGVTGPAPIVKL